MPYKVIVMNVDGTRTVTDQKKVPDYEQLKKAVDGYIETVPHFTKLEHEGTQLVRGTAYCNENGISEGKKFNAQATKEWLAALGPGPFRYEPRLLGPVIFYAKVK